MSYSTPHRTRPATGAVSYPLDIDASAEREGLAAERLCMLLGVEPQRSALQVLRDAATAAIARGLPEPVLTRYPLKASLRRWLSICDDYRAGRAPRTSSASYESPAERRARLERRLAKLSRALTIPAAAPAVDLERASAISGLSTRRLQFLIQAGRIPARRERRGKYGESWGYVVEPAHVREYAVGRYA